MDSKHGWRVRERYCRHEDEERTNEDEKRKKHAVAVASQTRWGESEVGKGESEEEEEEEGKEEESKQLRLCTQEDTSHSPLSLSHTHTSSSSSPSLLFLHCHPILSTQESKRMIGRTMDSCSLLSHSDHLSSVDCSHSTHTHSFHACISIDHVCGSGGREEVKQLSLSESWKHTDTVWADCPDSAHTHAMSVN